MAALASLFGIIILAAILMLIVVLIANWSDRPKTPAGLQSDRDEIRRLQRQVWKQTNLLADLDAEARAEYTVSQSNFAWSVSDKIDKNRERIQIED